MAQYEYDNRNNNSNNSYYNNSSRHDSYYARSRDTHGYSSLNQNGYSSSYDRRYAEQPPPLPKRSSAHSTYSNYRPDSRSHRSSRWPPAPAVEEEATALAKEVPVPATAAQQCDTGEAKSRGSVDQYPIIEEIEQPDAPVPVPDLNDERRFVLVTGMRPDANHSSSSGDSATRRTERRRRRSFAERGNMPPLKTDLHDPPVFTERISTPYVYKPQKESTAASTADLFLSPEPITPSATAVPRSVPSRDPRDAHRDQNARPSKQSSVHDRYDSFIQSPRVSKNDVSEDSDSGGDSTHLHAGRKPARYSFVKSDLQKEDLRTSLLESQAKADRKRAEQPSKKYAPNTNNASGSASRTSTPSSQSPHSSASSLKDDYPRRKTRAPEQASSAKTSRTYPDPSTSRPVSPFRPRSPVQREVPPSPPRSPQLPPHRYFESPTVSRPPSRSGTTRPPSRSGTTRPPSPLSSSTTLPLRRGPVTEADWHATYPPNPANDRSRPSTRPPRYESIPVPAHHINVQSPSPTRPLNPTNPLPYPVDDRAPDVSMPPEQDYQYDHSISSPSIPSSRPPYPDWPSVPPPPPAHSSPRERPSATFPRPTLPTRHSAVPEEPPRMTRTRSNSLRSQSSQDGRRSERRPASIDKPLPTCPRQKPSSGYDDWYTLDGCHSFDICPTCYIGVFADTPFDGYFKPVRRKDSRYCDFSSPWMRLAWLLTINQQRKGLELLYTLATIGDLNRPCPDERQVSGGEWYGILDQRDGIYVANFAICACDLKMTEALFPSIRGYMTRLPSTNQMERPRICTLRVTSKRFPKYLDLLLEIDKEAMFKGRAPDIQRFINMARDHATKEECNRGTPFLRRAWHFIPALPEFTVCAECYDEVVWPEIQKKHPIARSFIRNMQFVPGEDQSGTSCCLYSDRMRRIWARAIEDGDFEYLERKAMDRKKVEVRTARRKAELSRWLQNMANSGDYRDSEYDRLKSELDMVGQEWKRNE